MGSRNSISRMVPGVGLGVRLVVVDDFNIGGTSIDPAEADTPLIVYMDTALPGAAAAQRRSPAS
jgi:hypothetical protein